MDPSAGWGAASRVGEGAGLTHDPRSGHPCLHVTQYLKSLNLHFLKLGLVLQVADGRLLPADDGAVHGGLLQVLDAHLRHLQLKHTEGSVGHLWPRVPGHRYAQVPAPGPTSFVT